MYRPAIQQGLITRYAFELHIKAGAIRRCEMRTYLHVQLRLELYKSLNFRICWWFWYKCNLHAISVSPF